MMVGTPHNDKGRGHLLEQKKIYDYLAGQPQVKQKNPPVVTIL